MGIFNSDWQRIHKKICRKYELIALRNFESGLSPGGADVLCIITEIVREYFPNLSHNEVQDFVRNEYKSFKDFTVCDKIAQALKRMNPDIPEAGVSEIFEAVRKRFNNP